MRRKKRHADFFLFALGQPWNENHFHKHVTFLNPRLMAWQCAFTQNTNVNVLSSTHTMWHWASLVDQNGSHCILMVYIFFSRGGPAWFKGFDTRKLFSYLFTACGEFLCQRRAHMQQLLRMQRWCGNFQVTSRENGLRSEEWDILCREVKWQNSFSLIFWC